MKARYFSLLIVILLSTQNYAQDNDLPEEKSFVNIGLLGILCTNGEDTHETMNNLSISPIHSMVGYIKGFSIAPFNHVSHDLTGLQIGMVNSVNKKVQGAQIGIANSVNKEVRGVQIGLVNEATIMNGVQIGFANIKKKGGMQIGALNIADHNDFPIGLVNIIKDGDMNPGITIDEMSLLMSTFRSGGKHLYGVAGVGYSFASSIDHIVFEGGFGAHLFNIKQFRLDTEITTAYLTKIYVQTGEPEETKEKAKDYDYKAAFRVSVRLIPSIRIEKHFELFGGPTINYLQSHSMGNEHIFPKHYSWRKFTSKSLKQIHWGWIVGVQYKI